MARYDRRIHGAGPRRIGMVFIDSNIFFDMWDQDPVWQHWSTSSFLTISAVEDAVINATIYAELAPRFDLRIDLDRALDSLEVTTLDIPREAAFFAGLAHLRYRRQGGPRSGVLADFFIGAHALIENAPVVTRDPRRYRNYFPAVKLITPLTVA